MVERDPDEGIVHLLHQLGFGGGDVDRRTGEFLARGDAGFFLGAQDAGFDGGIDGADDDREALTVVRGVAGGNGWHAWQQLVIRYNPKTPARALMAMMVVMQPRKVKVVREPQGAVQEWEVKVKNRPEGKRKTDEQHTNYVL